MPSEARERTIYFIPPAVRKHKRVGIYCRVSTTHESQEESLEIQVKILKSVVAENPNWKLHKVYSDQDSGGNIYREGFQNMIFDCYEHKLDIVLVKTISRFGRNTYDVLDTIHRLKQQGVEVIFHQENLRTSNEDTDVILAALSAVAQAESQSMSAAIKWGLYKARETGKSRLYSRKCFGYGHDPNGELVILEEQAEVVRTIYDLYLKGLSIGLIIRELERERIKSPKGKDTWSKRAVQTILTNEKYIGNVLVGKTYTGEFPNNKQRVNHGERVQHLAENYHEPIIELEKYNRVQEEMQRRSNVETVNGKTKRKSTHYSAKRDGQD